MLHRKSPTFRKPANETHKRKNHNGHRPRN
jgi:hypothetical protein